MARSRDEEEHARPMNEGTGVDPSLRRDQVNREIDRNADRAHSRQMAANTAREDGTGSGVRPGEAMAVGQAGRNYGFRSWRARLHNAEEAGDYETAARIRAEGDQYIGPDGRIVEVQEGRDGLKRLTPPEAAEIIREDVEGSPAVDVNVQHTTRYCTEVCQHLGLEPNPVNMQRVADALKDAEIEPGHPEEFPKYVVVGQDAHGDDVSVIVHDEDEESKATSGQGTLAEQALTNRDIELQAKDHGKTKDQLEAEAQGRERRRSLAVKARERSGQKYDDDPRRATERNLTGNPNEVEGTQQGFTDVNEANRHPRDR